MSPITYVDVTKDERFYAPWWRRFAIWWNGYPVWDEHDPQTMICGRVWRGKFYPNRRGLLKLARVSPDNA